MTPKKSYNKIFLDYFSEKPIAFNPLLARHAGSVTAGLFLSQLLYWWGKGHDKKYIYKTIEEFKKETCLSRSEQDRAIKIWKEFGVLEVKRKGIPPIRHFSIKIDTLLELLKDTKKDANLHNHDKPFGETSKSISPLELNNTENTIKENNIDFLFT